MKALKQFRDKNPGVADLLNYVAVVDDGVVMGKDGSFLAGWAYRGDDQASSTPDELNAVSVRVNMALARLGNGWMTHIDAVRVPCESYPSRSESFFPDPVTELIDAERRSQYESESAHFVTQYMFVVTYQPPVGAGNKLSNYVYEGSGRETKDEKAEAGKQLAVFNRALFEIEDGLSAVVKLQRLKAITVLDDTGKPFKRDELLEWLQYCITGEVQPVRLPAIPMFLDCLLGGQEFWAGVTPKIGRQLLGVITVEGFPLEATPCMLTALDNLPLPFRWSTRYIYLDTETAKIHLDSYRKKWASKVVSFVDILLQRERPNIDRDAASMVDQAVAAIAEANSGMVAYGFLTTTIIVTSPMRDSSEAAARDARERLDANIREIRRLLQNLGFTARAETVNAVEAWLGSLPGHGAENVRRPMMNTLQMADMLPLAGIWAGRPRCPCPFYPPNSPPLAYATTEGATPYRLNLHVGDLGHTLILGPTGSGKSTLLAFLIAQFRRYKDATVFAFDKGNSLFALTHAVGGKHYEIGADIKGTSGDYAGPKFAPLSGIDNAAERSWACEWIETLCQLQGVTLTPTNRAEINRAMRNLAQAPADARSITAFVTNVQDADIKAALGYYTINGDAGFIFDHEIDDVKFGDFQVFEIEELMQRGDKIVIPALLYLFRRIELSLHGQPVLLPLDEAWVMLGHPVFKQKIREWAKVLRKANVILLLASQSLTDVEKSGILDVLLESCPTKIFLPNPNARQTVFRELYTKQIGFNDRQVELIALARPKREYYVCSDEGRRLINLELGPVAISFVGASGKKDIAAIRDLEAAHGAEWWREWLNQRHVKYSHLERKPNT